MHQCDFSPVLRNHCCSRPFLFQVLLFYIRTNIDIRINRVQNIQCRLATSWYIPRSRRPTSHTIWVYLEHDITCRGDTISLHCSCHDVMHDIVCSWTIFWSRIATTYARSRLFLYLIGWNLGYFMLLYISFAFFTHVTRARTHHIHTPIFIVRMSRAQSSANPDSSLAFCPDSSSFSSSCMFPLVFLIVGFNKVGEHLQPFWQLSTICLWKFV